MAKYVMSDLHGDYKRFKDMIDLINLTNEDELYIIGDIFDRGEDSYKILDYIIGHKNIYLIKGNHEKMFEEYYETGDASLWYYNGGRKTHEQLLKRGYIMYENIYSYIKRLPYIKVVDKFILAHGGIVFPKGYENMTIDELIKSQSENACLWDRSLINNERKFKDYTIICGHTPVQDICKKDNNTLILKRDGVIYIDCGCGCDFENTKLGCLRLDDLKEFYI